MHAVALASREIADALLLVGALQIEGSHVGARRDLAVAELDLLFTARNLLPHGPRGMEGIAALVHVGEFHRIAESECATIRSLLHGDHPEQGRLSRAVRPNDADDATARQVEREIVDQEAIGVPLRETARLDHQIAEARARGNDDLGGSLALTASFGQ